MTPSPPKKRLLIRRTKSDPKIENPPKNEPKNLSIYEKAKLKMLQKQKQKEEVISNENGVKREKEEAVIRNMVLKQAEHQVEEPEGVANMEDPEQVALPEGQAEISKIIENSDLLDQKLATKIPVKLDKNLLVPTPLEKLAKTDQPTTFHKNFTKSTKNEKVPTSPFAGLTWLYENSKYCHAQASFLFNFRQNLENSAIFYAANSSAKADLERYKCLENVTNPASLHHQPNLYEKILKYFETGIAENFCDVILEFSETQNSSNSAETTKNSTETGSKDSEEEYKKVIKGRQPFINHTAFYCLKSCLLSHMSKDSYLADKIFKQSFEQLTGKIKERDPELKMVNMIKINIHNIFGSKIIKLILEFLHTGKFDTSIFLRTKTKHLVGKFERDRVIKSELYKLILAFEYFGLLENQFCLDPCLESNKVEKDQGAEVDQGQKEKETEKQDSANLSKKFNAENLNQNFKMLVHMCKSRKVNLVSNFMCREYKSDWSCEGKYLCRIKISDVKGVR